MRLISLGVLIQVLKEEDLDNVYAVLERLFYEESLVVIDKEGRVVRVFFEPEEIYDYLEDLLNKEVEL